MEFLEFLSTGNNFVAALLGIVVLGGFVTSIIRSLKN